MPNNIDLSTEALLDRRALAEKATPGPWIRSTNNTLQCWGVVHLDMPYDGNGTTIIGDIDKRENSTFIAANSPDVVMADIDELIRLRAEVARLEKEVAWLAARCHE